MTDKEIIEQLREALDAVVDWSEANVAYGLPAELLKQACDALKLAGERPKSDAM